MGFVKRVVNILSFLLVMSVSLPVFSGDEITLEVTVIKGNTELPKFLYIVPWKSGEESQIEEQKLVLHGLFMGVLTPSLPELVVKLNDAGTNEIE